MDSQPPPGYRESSPSKCTKAGVVEGVRNGATRAGTGTGTAPFWQTDGHRRFMAGGVAKV